MRGDEEKVRREEGGGDWEGERRVITERREGLIGRGGYWRGA